MSRNLSMRLSIGVVVLSNLRAIDECGINNGYNFKIFINT